VKQSLFKKILGQCDEKKADRLFNEGCSACGSGNLQIGRLRFEEAAMLGHAQAQFSLGNLHRFRGNYDLARAYAWLTISSLSGGREAKKIRLSVLGDLRVYAIEDALWLLGTGRDLLFMGDRVIDKWLAEAEDNPVASLNLGFCSYFGRGIEKSHEEAVQWWHLSAEKENHDAAYMLGMAYSTIVSDEILPMFRNDLAANRGDAFEDSKEAVKWWKVAAEHCHERACVKLAECYHLGDGVDKDFGEAMRLWTQAASKGNSEALRVLGVLYFQGKFVEKNYGRAIEYLESSAQKGDVSAMTTLAVYYFKGDGEFNDVVKSYAWAKVLVDLDVSKGKDVFNVVEKKIKLGQIEAGGELSQVYMNQLLG